MTHDTLDETRIKAERQQALLSANKKKGGVERVAKGEVIEEKAEEQAERLASLMQKRFNLKP